MSGFPFGLIIGYLSWYAFRPNETTESVPIQKIAALLAVIGGATVLTLFPAGTKLFDYYSLGLAFGFFVIPLGNLTRNLLQQTEKMIKNRIWVNKKNTRIVSNQIESNWNDIEKTIRLKIESSAKVNENLPRYNCIDIRDLQELTYPQPLIEDIMRRFAVLYAKDGIEFKVLNGRPSLCKKRF